MSSPSAFGNYRVLHQIGSGVLGPVFRSYDSQRDRLVAIKAFKLDLIPEDAARLAEVFRTLASHPPAHPAIVGAVDAGLDGSTPFLALEYASGDSLDVSLRQSGATAIGRALPMLALLAEAIDGSWERGVGHGALHPRDIFTTAGGSEVRVTGFGIAQALEAVGAKAPIRRPYAAPERVTGSAWDRRADVYALGVIAHEVLTGRRSAGPADLEGALAAELTTDAQGALRGVLSAALAERPEDRFDSATAMVEALAAAAGAREQEPPKRAARARRPRVSAIDAPRLPGVDEGEDLPQPAPPVDPAREAAAQRAEPAIDRSIEPIIKIDVPGDAALSEPASFPWPATLAVALAGLVLGGVIGDQIGFRRGKATAIATAVNSAPATNAPTDAAGAAPASDAAPVISEPATADAAPAAAAAAGRLVIQSVPAGALVFVDGRRVGQAPVTVPDVPLGRHDVRLAHPGYVPATQRVTLSAATPTKTVRVRLRGGAGADSVEAATGSIDVDSHPRGARVTVDGRPLGQTPLRVPELSPGDHKVLLVLAGHKTVTSTVNVVAGERTRLAVTLEPGEAGGIVAPRKFR